MQRGVVLHMFGAMDTDSHPKTPLAPGSADAVDRARARGQSEDERA